MLEMNIAQREQWTKIGQTWFRGGGFVAGRYYDAKKAASEFESMSRMEDRINFLREFNGFFSVVSQRDSTILLAVDHVCSSPLYYSVDSSVSVSDSSGWVDENTPGGHDPYAATEYLHTMFVTGRDTVGKSTNQLQAGEYVLIDTDQSAIKDRNRYQLLDLGRGDEHVDEESFDTVLRNVAERLVTFADGRTICLALSGGSDSRLIALLLARVGYDNVVTYTHDLPSGSSNDIPVAKSISNELEFEHVSLNLSHKDYQQFYRSERWNEFLQTVDFLANIPNIHETVVLEKLKEKADLSEEPVDVRGHLPVPHGRDAFLPAILQEKPLISRSEFFDFLWNGHFIRWEMSEQAKQWKRFFCHRALECLPIDVYSNSSVETAENVAAALSQWYCQERAAKYVSFDLEYDFVGFDRWLPLWDKEYIGLLQTLELSQVINKHAHNDYVESLSNSMLDSSIEVNPTTTAGPVIENAKSQFWQTAKQGVKTLPNRFEYPIKDIGRSVLWQFTRGYESDPRYGLIEKDRFEQFNLDKYDAETFYYLLLFQDGAFDLPQWVELNNVA